MNKFGARKTVVDNITFASAKEANRYSELRLLERNGDIGCLRLQPRYPLAVNGLKICTYVADFEYYPADPQKPMVVEDAKGYRTPVFKLKAKLFEAIHGFKITEV